MPQYSAQALGPAVTAAAMAAQDEHRSQPEIQHHCKIAEVLLADSLPATACKVSPEPATCKCDRCCNTHGSQEDNTQLETLDCWGSANSVACSRTASQHTLHPIKQQQQQLEQQLDLKVRLLPQSSGGQLCRYDVSNVASSSSSSSGSNSRRSSGSGIETASATGASAAAALDPTVAATTALAGPSATALPARASSHHRHSGDTNVSSSAYLSSSSTTTTTSVAGACELLASVRCSRKPASPPAPAPAAAGPMPDVPRFRAVKGTELSNIVNSSISSICYWTEHCPDLWPDLVPACWFDYYGAHPNSADNCPMYQALLGVIGSGGGGRVIWDVDGNRWMLQVQRAHVLCRQYEEETAYWQQYHRLVYRLLL